MLAADEVLVVNAGDSGNVRSRLTRTFLSRQTVTTNRNHVVPVTMATRLPRGRLYGEHDPADRGVRRRPGLVPGPAAAYPRATCPRPQGLAEGTPFKVRPSSSLGFPAHRALSRIALRGRWEYNSRHGVEVSLDLPTSSIPGQPLRGPHSFSLKTIKTLA